MSEDYRWREFERRMERVERAAEQVPLIAHQVGEIREDTGELRDNQKNVTRALYTTALSIAGGSVLFFVGVLEVLK